MAHRIGKINESTDKVKVGFAGVSFLHPLQDQI